MEAQMESSQQLPDADRAPGAEETSRDAFRRRIDANYTLNLQEIEQGKVELESRPPYFQIDLIGVCDMKPYCRMCTIDISHTRAHGGLALDVLHSYGEFADHCLQITNCSTGEPLLHRELEGFLAFAQQRDKRFGFSSNALAMNREKADLLLRYGDALALNVSLDAASADTYGKVRCDAWDRVVENLRHFCARRLELPVSQRPHFGLCFVPMRLNQHEVDAFFDLGAELGVDYIELRPLIQFPANKIVTHDGFTFNYHEQLLSQAEIELCRRQGLAASERTGVRLNWQYETSGDDPYVLFRPAEVEEIKTPCTMPWTFLLPYENGDTVPCCYMANSVGDWRRDGLETVWNGPILQGVRSALAGGQLASECLKSPSCPVVKKALQNGREQRLDAYLQQATDASGHRVLKASDAPFQELIGFGIYEEEGGRDGQPAFRWLADLARLELPALYGGRPFEIGLRMRAGNGEAHLGAATCKVSVNGKAVGEPRAPVDGWATSWMPVTGAGDGVVELDFECPHAFTPKDLGVSKDRRLLGVMLSEVHLRPAVAKQSSQLPDGVPAPSAHGVDGLIDRYLDHSRDGDGDYVLKVDDAEFQELVRFGMYRFEHGDDGEAFRWLADSARFQIPNPFRGQPFEVGLRLRAGKTDARIAGAVCRVSVNGEGVGESCAAEDTWVDRWHGVRGKHQEALTFDLSFPHAFSPKEFGHSADGRLLGGVLAEVRLRPVKAKGWWQRWRSALGGAG